jgi:hypothetical protein
MHKVYGCCEATSRQILIDAPLRQLFSGVTVFTEHLLKSRSWMSYLILLLVHRLSQEAYKGRQWSYARSSSYLSYMVRQHSWQ